MDTSTESKDGASETAPLVANGLIADSVAFKATMNAHIKRICAVRRSWASEEATEFFVTLFDEYVAQLPTIEQVVQVGDKEVKVSGCVMPDAGDLKGYIARMVNMNAVNNRYADADMITRNPKGSRKVNADLL